MSFFTCFCDLPQKEHFSRSPPSPIRATYGLLPSWPDLMPGPVSPAPPRRRSAPAGRDHASTLPGAGPETDPPRGGVFCAERTSSARRTEVRRADEHACVLAAARLSVVADRYAL